MKHCNQVASPAGPTEPSCRPPLGLRGPVSSKDHYWFIAPTDATDGKPQPACVHPGRERGGDGCHHLRRAPGRQHGTLRPAVIVPHTA